MNFTLISKMPDEGEGKAGIKMGGGEGSKEKSSSKRDSERKLKCPVFSGKQADYVIWRDKVEDWMHLTRHEAESHGLIIKQGLDGKAYETVMSLDRSVIRGPQGGEEVIKKLDELFVKEKVWDNYDRLLGYLHISRKKKETVRDYVARYEFLEAECRRTGNSRLEGELKAIHILDGANLTDQECNMVISACGQDELEFEKVRKVMKRIFDKSQRIEEEESWVEGPRRRDFRKDEARANYERKGERKNPVNKFGAVSKCVVCSSEFHWARECPRNVQNKTRGEPGKAQGEFTGEKGERVYASREVEKEYWGEVEAILDTGCKSTLMGPL